MASRMRADPRSTTVARVAAALGAVDPPSVRVFARSKRTGAEVCEVRHQGDRLFGRVYPAAEITPRAPQLLLSDQFRASEPARVHAEELVAREWRALTELSRVGDAHAAVPDPVARSETVLLCSWVEGTPLQQVAGRTRWARGDVDGLIARMRSAGRWLRAVHGSAGVENGTFDLDEEAAAVASLADRSPARVQRHLALARDLLSEAGRRLDARRVRLPVTVTHGDFSLPNVLVTSSGIVMVDFEHFGRRPALHDLVAFVANLRAKLADPRYRRADVVAWEHAFWEGYGPSASDRVLGSVLGTTWLLTRFAPRKLRRRWTQAALAVADRLGRGFSEDLLRTVTWRLAQHPDQDGRLPGT